MPVYFLVPFLICTCILPKMNRVYYPHLLTSFSLFSRVGGKKKMQAPVVERFLFPRSTEFVLKVLIQLRIPLKGREGGVGLHKNQVYSLNSL